MQIYQCGFLSSKQEPLSPGQDISEPANSVPRSSPLSNCQKCQLLWSHDPSPVEGDGLTLTEIFDGGWGFTASRTNGGNLYVWEIPSQRRWSDWLTWKARTCRKWTNALLLGLLKILWIIQILFARRLALIRGLLYSKRKKMIDLQKAVGGYCSWQTSIRFGSSDWR